MYTYFIRQVLLCRLLGVARLSLYVYVTILITVIIKMTSLLRFAECLARKIYFIITTAIVIESKLVRN